MGVHSNVIADAYRNVSRNDYWKNIDQLRSITHLSSEEILREVKNSGMFFESTDASGIPVFTTKDNFRKYQSFGKKLIGAFRNRID